MNEEEIKKAVADLEMCNAQLETLRKQDELFRINLEEFLRARDTLNGIKGKKEGDELLVPIGANFFIKANIGDPDNVVSNLGATVAAGESLDKAIERLERHLKELNEAGQGIAKTVSELEMTSGLLTQQLQEEYAKMQSEEK